MFVVNCLWAGCYGNRCRTEKLRRRRRSRSLSRGNCQKVSCVGITTGELGLAHIVMTVLKMFH